MTEPINESEINESEIIESTSDTEDVSDAEETITESADEEPIVGADADVGINADDVSNAESSENESELPKEDTKVPITYRLKKILSKCKVVGKSAISMVGKFFKCIHDWFWGTEEKPTPPFSKRGKFRRWFLIKFRGYCTLIRTKYIRYEDDNEEKIVDEYMCTYELIRRRDVPRDAVHVTGMKNTWHIDELLIKRGFSSVVDKGFTAVDAFAYMKCNKIDEAMAIKLDRVAGMDPEKIVLILALVIGGLLSVWYLFMQ